MNQRGSINLAVVLAAVFGLALAASMYLNVVQHQSAAQDHKLQQGVITDLRYQVNQDNQVASAAPTPDASPTPLATPAASATPVPAPTPTPAVLDASTTPKTTTIKKPGNIHLGPTTSSKILLAYTRLPAGTSVTLGTASGAWQQITINNITGYILASSLN